jgi:hypothetical protein
MLITGVIMSCTCDVCENVTVVESQSHKRSITKSNDSADAIDTIVDKLRRDSYSVSLASLAEAIVTHTHNMRVESNERAGSISDTQSERADMWMTRAMTLTNEITLAEQLAVCSPTDSC